MISIDLKPVSSYSTESMETTSHSIVREFLDNVLSDGSEFGALPTQGREACEQSLKNIIMSSGMYKRGGQSLDFFQSAIDAAVEEADVELRTFQDSVTTALDTTEQLKWLVLDQARENTIWLRDKFTELRESCAAERAEEARERSFEERTEGVETEPTVFGGTDDTAPEAERRLDRSIEEQTRLGVWTEAASLGTKALPLSTPPTTSNLTPNVHPLRADPLLIQPGYTTINDLQCRRTTYLPLMVAVFEKEYGDAPCTFLEKLLIEWRERYARLIGEVDPIKYTDRGTGMVLTDRQAQLIEYEDFGRGLKEFYERKLGDSKTTTDIPEVETIASPFGEGAQLEEGVENTSAGDAEDIVPSDGQEGTQVDVGTECYSVDGHTVPPCTVSESAHHPLPNAPLPLSQTLAIPAGRMTYGELQRRRSDLYPRILDSIQKSYNDAETSFLKGLILECRLIYSEMLRNGAVLCYAPEGMEIVLTEHQAQLILCEDVEAAFMQMHGRRLGQSQTTTRATESGTIDSASRGEGTQLEGGRENTTTGYTDGAVPSGEQEGTQPDVETTPPDDYTHTTPSRNTPNPPHPDVLSPFTHPSPLMKPGTMTIREFQRRRTVMHLSIVADVQKAYKGADCTALKKEMVQWTKAYSALTTLGSPVVKVTDGTDIVLTEDQARLVYCEDYLGALKDMYGRALREMQESKHSTPSTSRSPADTPAMQDYMDFFNSLNSDDVLQLLEEAKADVRKLQDTPDSSPEAREAMSVGVEKLRKIYQYKLGHERRRARRKG